MDRIVYLVKTKPGGIDGTDCTDKGGVVKYATYSKKDAENNCDYWLEIEKKIIDEDEQTELALAKLDAVDKLILGITKSKFYRD